MGWDEERLVVLRMVRDGRLDPAEAVRLLRAIDRAESKAGPDGGPYEVHGAHGIHGAHGPYGGGPGGGAAAPRGEGGGSQPGSYTTESRDRREDGAAGGGTGSGDRSGDDRIRSEAGATRGGHTGGAGMSDQGGAANQDDGAHEAARGDGRGRRYQWEDMEAWRDWLGERLDAVRERVEEAVRSAWERAERGAASGRDELDKAWDVIQRTVSQVVSEIPQRLGRTAGTSFLRMEWDPQRRRSVQTEQQPLVLPDLEPGSSIEIVTRNGSVTVEGTDGPATASVKMWLRADTPQEVEERVRAILQSGGNGNRWWLKTAEERGEAVEIRLALPRKLQASLQASAVNGRLKVADVNLASLHLRTENGEVEISRVQAARSQVETVNGPLTLEGLAGEQAEAGTVNGSLRARVNVREGRFRTLNGLLEVQPLLDAGAGSATGPDVQPPAGGIQDDHALEPERRYDLESTNGRVRVAVAAQTGVGYRFQLHSVEGRISLGLDDISHVVNQVSEPGGSIQVESFDYQRQPRRVSVQVRSLNGPIQVESGTL